MKIEFCPLPTFFKNFLQFASQTAFATRTEWKTSGWRREQSSPSELSMAEPFKFCFMLFSFHFYFHKLKILFINLTTPLLKKIKTIPLHFQNPNLLTRTKSNSTRYVCSLFLFLFVPHLGEIGFCKNLK